MDFPIFGSLGRDQIVQVVAQDGSGFWYLVRLSNGNLAWVSTAYVTTPQGTVPVAATIPARPSPTATLTPAPPTNTPNSGPISGPGGSGGPTPTNTPFILTPTNTPFSPDD